MHEKYTWPTYTRTPIVHVRQTRLAYIHSGGNSSCTQNTPGVHTLGRQFFIIAHFLPGLPLFRLPYSGVLAHLAHKTYLAYIHSNPNSACTKNTPGLHTLEPQLSMYAKHAWPTYTRTPIVHVRKKRPAYIYYSAFLPGLPLFRHIPGHRYGTTIDKCTTIDKAPP